MSSVVNVLKLAEIFDNLTSTQMELIASICVEKQYTSGELLFAENTPGDGLYVIANGSVEILVDPSLVAGHYAGEPYTLATLRRGQSFGEISLVDEGGRSASARITQHDTRLIQIPRKELILLCDTYPALGYRLMRNLAADLAMKIRTTDLKVRDHLYWTHLKEHGGESSNTPTQRA
ncbi:MAG: cyclic nucleotide-binding domain-containing protein [Aggregatilineales bacterium]